MSRLFAAFAAPDHGSENHVAATRAGDYTASTPEGACLESVSAMNALASVVSDETGPYRPSDDEPFMNERQLAYFKKKLLDWKDDILRESKGTVVNLKAETENHPDLVDRATSESDRALELRTRDRQRKLISKIDDALRRIEDGSYGYCEDTGEPISLGRLEARPTATLSVEAQERHERRERVHRDD